MRESILFWPVRLEDKTLYILDETRIPWKVSYLKVRDYRQAAKAVVQMKTRAFGQFLTVCYAFVLEAKKMPGGLKEEQMRRLQEVAEAFNKSRPTFPFEEVTSMMLGFAKKVSASQDFSRDFINSVQGFLEGNIRQKRYARARAAAVLLKDGARVLTHCNVSGELPLVAEFCREANKKIKFYATETRPYFQGARLTAWELKREGFDVTLVPDNAVAKLMADSEVDCVLVGSDRSARNGDFANKVGTYQIALLSRHFHVPFYVLSQASDKLASGREIPIEIRDDDEILTFAGRRLSKKGVAAYYPGFDVVPNELIARHIAIDVS